MNHRLITTSFLILIGTFIHWVSPKISKDFDVAFITSTPSIDGKLDSNLEYLEIKTFSHIWQFDNPVTDTALVTYRMAYTPSHLYLYIETDVDSVSYHRRGYLWGDGYKVLLGIPQKDKLTNEYYELSYSPSIEENYLARQQIVNHNFSQGGKKLSSSSKSAEAALEGKSGFEALIAWADIEPYHPWFMDEMGYNIYFAKGIESKDHGYFTNGYAVVEDEGIWDEEIPRRNYKQISFEQPTDATSKALLAKPMKTHLQIGEPLLLKVAGVDIQTSIDTIIVTLSDLNEKEILSEQLLVAVDRALSQKEFTIDIGSLASGIYNLNVENSDGIMVTETIVIQPTIDFHNLGETIEENVGQLNLGTKNTLQFELNQIEAKSIDLKDYDSGEGILEDWKLFQNKYEAFVQGNNPYENFRKPYRRAFKSKYDDTYQPYTLNLPDNYDPNKKYPLLVFMHGSGRDEQGILDRPRSNGQFIEIAPLARDIYRAYAGDDSQKDIIEAIEDVSKHFPIDMDKIIIGGFSMGGYGALRTYYEHPELYKGVAVFAGHPDIANAWLDGEHPNFLDEKYLESFSDMPVFIYHGKKDPALDVGLIEKMSVELKKAGAVVTVSLVDENGHEYQDEKTNQLYYEWLDKITNP